MLPPICFLFVCSLTAAFIMLKTPNLSHSNIPKSTQLLQFNLHSSLYSWFPLQVSHPRSKHLSTASPEHSTAFSNSKISKIEFIIFPPSMCSSFPINGTKSNPQSWFLLLSFPRWQHLSNFTSLCQSKDPKHRSIKWFLTHHFQRNPLSQGYKALVWPSTTLAVLIFHHFPISPLHSSHINIADFVIVTDNDFSKLPGFLMPPCFLTDYIYILFLESYSLTSCTWQNYVTL